MRYDATERMAGLFEPMVAPHRQGAPCANLSEASDADLVHAVQHGEMGAAAILWRRHASFVRRTAVHQLGPDAAIDDIVQEVFLVFLEAPHTIRHPDMIMWFLNGAATRMSLYTMRQRRNAKRLLAAFAEMQLELRAAPADLDATRVLQALDRVLERMPARQSRAFVLRHLRGLTLTEIAHELDTSSSTVRRDLTNAQHSIRRSGEPALSQHLGESGMRSRWFRSE